MTDKLKPCPFCGSDNVMVIEEGHVGHPTFKCVCCFDCDATGPKLTHERRYRKLWQEAKR